MAWESGDDVVGSDGEDVHVPVLESCDNDSGVDTESSSGDVDETSPLRDVSLGVDAGDSQRDVDSHWFCGVGEALSGNVDLDLVVGTSGDGGDLEEELLAVLDALVGIDGVVEGEHGSVEESASGESDKLADLSGGGTDSSDGWGNGVGVFELTFSRADGVLDQSSDNSDVLGTLLLVGISNTGSALDLVIGGFNDQTENVVLSDENLVLVLDGREVLSGDGENGSSSVRSDRG